MDHQHDAGGGGGGGGGVMAAFEEEVIAMIKKKCYREASECIKMAMEAYPEDFSLKVHCFRWLIISETLHYGTIILPDCDNACDYYSVLHLPPSGPSSTYKHVNDRFHQLRDELYPLKNKGFHDLFTLAGSFLYLAKSSLCERSIRSHFYNKRKDSVFLDWPSNTSEPTTTCSLIETYLAWKPPVYRADAIHHMKYAAPPVYRADAIHHMKYAAHLDADADADVESDDDDDASLSKELRILKKKVFDEMPQNPHYTPLEKYSGRVREGMILGLKVAFTELCEDIENLEDVQSFWDELDDFNEEISQLKEMGYNVDKVSERIAILKIIAEHKRASGAAAKKCENEVRDREANVIDLQKRISELQTEIEESKSKIQTFNKNSSDAGAKFAAIVKYKWV